MKAEFARTYGEILVPLPSKGQSYSVDELAAHIIWLSSTPSEVTTQRQHLWDEIYRELHQPGKYSWEAVKARLLSSIEGRLLLDITPSPGERFFRPTCSAEEAQSAVRRHPLLGLPSNCDFRTLQSVAMQHGFTDYTEMSLPTRWLTDEFI